jgi:hypothetical protein
LILNKKGTREMKDTITLAELRKTELYRKEQTRPLREFLMENIDVLKLADEVEMWGEDLLALNMKGGIPVVQGAKMLRQQADLIRNLEKSLGFKNSGYETINLTPQLELTDEEIKELSEQHLDMDWQTGVIEFARAILRKAQEK